MGFLTDLLAAPKSFNSTPPLDPKSRTIVHQLKALIANGHDGAYPSGTAAANAVQSIAQYGGTATAGTFTLKFTLFSGQQFTTASIAYGANAATIQTAVDTAATSASVPGYTDGDIVINGGPLTSAALTVTYSGNSVKASNVGLVAIAVSGLTGGTVGAVAATTVGQSNRPAWALLSALGVVTSGIPAQGVSPTDLVVGVEPGFLPVVLHQDALMAVINEAMFNDDQPGVKTALLAALGFPLANPLVS